ncbi:autotransporter-associated beta strand repeat-containing protein [Reyranella sp. CPCC 100927]|uniref:autotransporter-associated beta strand repeat-containing protein n=1 Tax=Reyranella sp. CPCC 100927 TaxID=2599616 RepID=UPI0011B7385F|nr:autotransporter-associated beta strand repeat-containing protein [Reyranella sp. CPCC 100927]TWS95805.1 autotransporter domain-containing protein [Reyranella sp. CPCC 100927]
MGLLVNHCGSRRFEHHIFKWALLSTLALPLPAAAQVVNWVNPGEGAWQDPANWSTGAVPTAGSFVRVDNGGSAIIDAIAAAASGVNVSSASTSMLTIRNGGTLTSRNATIGDSFGTVGAAVVDGAGSRWTITDILFGNLGIGQPGTGSLTISNGGVVSVGGRLSIATGGSTGTLTVTGPGSQFTSSDADVSRGNGNGTINVLNGGTVTFTGRLLLGFDQDADGSATVSGTGSSLVVGQNLFLGAGLSATGRLTVANGGTVTVNAGAGSIEIGPSGGTPRGFINIGAAPGDAAVAPGTLNITGISGGSPGSEINFNHTSAAYIFVPQINGGATVRVFSGTTTLLAANTYTGGTVLNGGTLAVLADTALGDAAGGLSFDGGTLRVTGTGFTSTPRTITWGPGGGGFDIADPANSFTAGQVLSGTGGLAKLGAGTLVLTGANTYTGATVISGGTLRIGVGGTIAASSAVTLSASGATLDIAPGNDQTVRNLAGVAGTSVVLGSNLTVASTTDTAFAGTISGSAELRKTGAGRLTLTGASTYTGATFITSGTLALGSGGSIAPSAFVALNAGATLDIAGGGDQTLRVLGGEAGATVALGANTLTTGADSANFSGTITGTGGLVKSGAGLQGLTGTNTYTGATTITGGTLLLAATDAIATSSSVTLSASGATLAAGSDTTVRNLGGVAGSSVTLGSNALTVVSSTNTTFAGVISGAGGDLIKSGTGTLTLTGANTYSGGTTISAGTLQLGNGGATGSITGNVINNGVLAINRNGVVLDGVIFGSGALHQAGPGTTILTANNTYTGGTTISAGVLQLGSGGATGAITGNVINNGRLFINRAGGLVLDGVISGAGDLIQAAGTTVLTADNTYSGGTQIFNRGALQLGNGGATGAITGGIVNNGTLAIYRSGLYTFDGAISGNGALRQIGTGTTVLTADSSAFAGSTTVASGTLRVDGALGGAVTVGESGTLSGGGTIAGGVTVNGTLSAGASPGTLTVGTLTLNGGSTSVFELNAPGIVGGASNDLVIVTNNLTLGGALQAQAAAGGYYRLFNYGGTLSGSFASTTVTGTGGFTVVNQQLQTSIPNQVNLAVIGAGQQLQFWDGGDSTGNGNVDGGAGTWNGAGTNWTGQPGQAGINSTWAGSVAVFAGAAGGAVTVGGPQAFDTLQFSTNGYVVSGSNLTLAPASGTAGTITVDSSITATIGSIIADGTATGLNKIGGGTLVLTGANTYTGATTVSAGTLRIGTGGSIAASSAVTLSASGATLDIAAAGNSFVRNLAGVAGSSVVLGGNLIITSTTDTTFAGIFSGGGVLFKDGAATQTLTGANTHTGVTNVSGGTLALGPGGSIALSRGVVILAGATFDITAAGDQTVQSLSGSAGGTVVLGANTLTVNTANSIFSGVITGSGGLVKTGTGLQALGGTNTYTGATTIAGGTLLLATTDAIATSRSVTLSASGATLALGTDQTVQNLGGVSGSIVTLGANMLTMASSTDTIFAGAIGGTGGLVKAGTGTLTLTGTSTYSGATTLTAGRLTVNGAIASSIVSVTAGTLAGTGAVGGIVATGGTVAPGNSIGTLNVAGNVSFAPGTTYEVEIEPAGGSDLLHATGTATITGGTVSVIKATGSYTPGTRYTILTADAGVTGTFTGFTQNLPFIDLTLAYDLNNVFLLVTRNGVTFCSLAGSANQCAAANGAGSLGAGNALYDAIASLTDAASARQAFNAISGEVHASTRSALIEDSHYLRDAVVTRTRLSGMSSTGAAPQFAALAQATDQSQRPQDGTAITAWFQGFGAIARTSGDGNAASAKRTTGGFFIGADTRIAETWTVGLATGYSRSTIDVDGRSSRATIDSYHLALYGGAQFGPIGLRLGASHTWHSIDSSRSIAFPGVADAARADYKARTTQVFGDVGYALALGDVAVEPFANLAWVHLSTNRFGERGGIAALRARGGSDSNLFSTLGVRAAAQVWNGDNKTLTLRGTLGWRHAFGDVTPAARLAFAGGASFGVEGVPIARNAVVVEAGFDLKVGKAFTVGAAYSGILASGAHDHAFKGNLTYRF